MESEDRQLKKVGKYCYEPSSEPLNKTKFGDIYQGYDSNGDAIPIEILVVPKKILTTTEDQNIFQTGLTAYTNISTLKLEQMVRLRGDSSESSSNYYLVMDACNGKTLESLLKEKQKFSEEFVLDIVKRVALLFDLFEKHELKGEGDTLVLLHRNIKPKNIIFHDDRAKLTGFGFSRLIRKGATSAESFAGTPQYMSPQLLGMTAYTNKCDVWSLGIVAYTALFGKKPWVAVNERFLLQTIKATPLEFPEEISKETAELLRQMLQFDEDKRINWKEILDHPALKVKNQDQVRIDQAK